ncbi:hypothetical protein SAMN05216587_10627 [Selenomonas ruminantium]|jgi:hypothetical protein|uniref:Type I toxin-antitoxin system Fst family toxin n=1 Tax=Selenomonas ruminantium TaxID=971 RepID=A0A1I0XIM6_SELRU|nr:hypothetical protein SAMN05216587_10627 [Selenomonas ruminantium]
MSSKEFILCVLCPLAVGILLELFKYWLNH